MGLINRDVMIDRRTGQSMPNTYIFISNVEIVKNGDVYRAQTTFKYYYDKDAKLNGLDPIDIHVLGVEFDSSQLSNLYTFLYSKFKELFPNMEDVL